MAGYDLERITRPSHTPQPELYAGFVVQVALSQIAQTLTEGGDLGLIGAPARAPVQIEQ